MNEKDRQQRRDLQELQGQLKAAESDLHIKEATLTEDIHIFQGQLKRLESDLSKASKRAELAEDSLSISEKDARKAKSDFEANTASLEQKISFLKRQLKEAEKKASQTALEFEEELRGHSEKARHLSLS